MAAAGECLKAILATSSGSEVLNKLETGGECDQWCGFLVPFKLMKRKKVLCLVCYHLFVPTYINVQMVRENNYICSTVIYLCILDICDMNNKQWYLVVD